MATPGRVASRRIHGIDAMPQGPPGDIHVEGRERISLGSGEITDALSDALQALAIRWRQRFQLEPQLVTGDVQGLVGAALVESGRVLADGRFTNGSDPLHDNFRLLANLRRDDARAPLDKVRWVSTGE